MLGKLAPGDVVTVTRIDRLARSTFDLFGIVKRIVDAKAQFRSLAEPWADTGTSTGRLMLGVLGGLRTWNAILSAPAPPKAGAAPRPKESTWADLLPSHRHRSKRPPDAAHRARRYRNWRTATIAAWPPCAALCEQPRFVSGALQILPARPFCHVKLRYDVANISIVTDV